MLTDLEICKKIAEIEGRTYWSSGHGEGLHLHYIEGNANSRILYYNPLTDDALCFKLMVKYEIERCYEPYDFIGWSYHSRKSNNPAHVTERTYWGEGEETADLSPNKAICLAIIESHK